VVEELKAKVAVGLAQAKQGLLSDGDESGADLSRSFTMVPSCAAWIAIRDPGDDASPAGHTV
jgi:hypothetical protein